MDIGRIGLLSNPYAGTGRDNVLTLARKAYECLAGQAEILVGPGDMGQSACPEGVAVVGQNTTRTRVDTIETAKQMVARGVELFVIVSGDGTYNDALEGRKAVGATLPILGVAAGRFNTQFPKRKYDPFVSMRGVFRPFRLTDLVIDDVPGLVVRVDAEIVSYGFFWAVISNALAYTDAGGNLATIDAGAMLDGAVIPLSETWPVASESTRIVIRSRTLGEIALGRGPEMSLPIVAPVVGELGQILAGGLGAFAEIMGLHGIAYYFEDKLMPFLPTPAFYPVKTRSAAFFEGDRVELTRFRAGAVVQVDSTPIRRISGENVVTVEVVQALGKKARLLM